MSKEITSIACERDLEQVLQPIGIELIGTDAGDDPPDGSPVDPDQPGDRCLVSPGRQPRDQALEIAGEAGAVTSEGDALDPHAVLGALETMELAADLEPPDPEVEMTPDRIDPLTVVAMPGRVVALRADQPPARERDGHDDPILAELNVADPYPVEAEQARESRGDAHRRPPVELLTFKQRAACLAGTAGASPTPADGLRPTRSRSRQGSRPQLTDIDAGSPPFLLNTQSGVPAPTRIGDSVPGNGPSGEQHRPKRSQRVGAGVF
jgi:hypothetical protein